MIKAESKLRQITLKLLTTNFPTILKPVDLLCKSTDWFLYDWNIGR